MGEVLEANAGDAVDRLHLDLGGILDLQTLNSSQNSSSDEGAGVVLKLCQNLSMHQMWKHNCHPRNSAASTN